MMPDPMIREERGKAPRPITVFSDGEELPRPAVAEAEKPAEEPPKPETPPKKPDAPALTPAITPSLPEDHPPKPSMLEHKPGAVFSPANSPTVGNPEALRNAAAVNQTRQVAKAPTPPVQPEPPTGQELRIPAGHGIVHHKPRTWVWVVAAIIILVWTYAAVDALTDVKLPYELFTEPASQTETLYGL
jgi:hypothetical protein